MNMSVDSIQWDNLSNLCLDRSSANVVLDTRSAEVVNQPLPSSYEDKHEAPEHKPKPTLLEYVAQRRCSNLPEMSLYPNEDELLATSLAECSVEDIFSNTNQANSNCQPTPPSSSYHIHEQPNVSGRTLLRRNTSDPQLTSNTDRSPGAFYSSSISNLTNKPPKPTWVEKSTQVEQKIELQHRKPNYDHNNDEEQLPTTECGGDVPCHSTTTTRKHPPRPEVEVSPGMYMPLRGTDETLQAIESGHGKLVFCLACSTALQCVPDCDLVICPDCRVFSPVPKFVDDNFVYDEEDYAAAAGVDGEQLRSLPPQWIGGVGLGLKVSFLD